MREFQVLEQEEIRSILEQEIQKEEQRILQQAGKIGLCTLLGIQVDTAFDTRKLAQLYVHYSLHAEDEKEGFTYLNRAVLLYPDVTVEPFFTQEIMVAAQYATTLEKLHFGRMTMILKPHQAVIDCANTALDCLRLDTEENLENTAKW